MSTAKKKVAVVGYGGMGGWHTRYILESDVVELAGIWDIKAERRELAKERNIFVYDSLDALLADESVEIVLIATPNDVHMPIAIAALGAGKNVISEKPVTLSSDELLNIFGVSSKTGKLFTVHQNRRWDKDYLMMNQVYHSGELGDVFSIESRVQGSRGIPGDWRKEKEHGGGMILDWGVHLIDQMLQLVDDKKIEKIYCKCDHITNDEVDDGFKLDLYFEKGLTARIEVGTSHFISLPRYYMAGTKGAALVEGWKTPCKVVYCFDENEKDVAPVVTAAGLTKTMAPRDGKTIAEYELPQPESDVHDYYRNFCAAIDGKTEQAVTHPQMLRVMRVMEAAFQSDALGTPVDFDDDIC